MEEQQSKTITKANRRNNKMIFSFRLFNFILIDDYYTKIERTDDMSDLSVAFGVEMRSVDVQAMDA